MSEETPTTAVEADPEDLAEEHAAEDDPVRTQEDYDPDPVVDDATREADTADVAEQLAEVPDDGTDDQGDAVEEY